MKKHLYTAFFSVIFYLLALLSCTVENEIFDTNTNIINPQDASNQIIPITHDSVRAKATFDTLGNLNIQRHGWVWALNSMAPSLSNALDSLPLGPLAVNTFSAEIGNFHLGETYYFRSYVNNGNSIVYGDTISVFMGIPKVEIPVEIDNTIPCYGFTCTATIAPGASVKECGILYKAGTDGEPTFQNNKAKADTFTSTVPSVNFEVYSINLSPGSPYIARSYVIVEYANSADRDTGYSSVTSFTAPFKPLLTAEFTINTDTAIFDGAIVTVDSNKSLLANSYLWNFGTQRTSALPETRTVTGVGTDTLRLISKTNDGCEAKKEIILKISENFFNLDSFKHLGGSFEMGCVLGPCVIIPTDVFYCNPDECDRHLVHLDSFWIGKTEVTQKQWEAVMGKNNNPSYHTNCANCPVESVTWQTIDEEFLIKLKRKTGVDYFLPTEAEWEFAAWGGEYSKYSGSDSLDLVGWNVLNSTDTNSMANTHSVGMKTPNMYGLFDMTGNVSEWCWDKYWDNYYRDLYSTCPPPCESKNPKYDGSMGVGRVVRGGNYGDYEDILHTSGRTLASDMNRRIGFRLVRRD